MKGFKIYQIIFQVMEILRASFFKIIFFLSYLLSSFLSYDAYAQDLINESTAPVEVHEKKTSSVSFPKNTYITSKANTEDQEAGNELSSSTSYMLFVPRDEINDPSFKKALVYELPPVCRESKTVMDEVFHHTEGTENLDILVYNSSDASQADRVKKYNKVSVPWDPSYDPTEGQETKDARFQDLIRVLNPECLPARYRFVYVGSKRYNEMRYGLKAFEQ